MNIGAKETRVMGAVYMVTLHTDNFLSMKAFYTQKLEMDVIHEDEAFIELASNGIRLSLVSRESLNRFIPTESLQNQRTGSGVGIGFKYETSEAVDNVYKALVSREVEIVSGLKLQAWGDYTAFFTDPDGNVHELVSN